MIPITTREHLEQALARHTVRYQMGPKRFWLVKRNGATKTWKTRPNDWRIPLKVGFRSHWQATQDNIANGVLWEETQ